MKAFPLVLLMRLIIQHGLSTHSDRISGLTCLKLDWVRGTIWIIFREFSHKGLDYDEDLIAHLQVKHPFEIMPLPTCHWTVLLRSQVSETYDTVFCCNVLEHIEDDRAALDRLMATLKPAANCFCMYLHFSSSILTWTSSLGITVGTKKSQALLGSS